MNGWKTLAGGALLLIAQGVGAVEEEDIELTMHEGEYLTVAVTHKGWLGQEEDRESTAPGYYCEGEEPE